MAKPKQTVMILSVEHTDPDNQEKSVSRSVHSVGNEELPIYVIVHERWDRDGNLVELEVRVENRTAGASITAEQLSWALALVPEQVALASNSKAQADRANQAPKPFTPAQKRQWVQLFEDAKTRSINDNDQVVYDEHIKGKIFDVKVYGEARNPSLRTLYNWKKEALA